jgi:CRISPR system Cascade subunit CasC
MLVELHIIQNFAPANLNRDDTGAPKDCEFGGVRRARISSQCLKRAVRTAFETQDLLPGEHRAKRTKRLRDELTERLVAAGRPRELAQAVAEAAITSAGLSVDKEGRTQYLLFLGEREIASAAKVCLQHWDALAEGATTGEPSEGTRPQGREAKRAARAALPEVRKAMEALLTGGKAADLALFGRMLADLPDRNIDAASQVAHAISTHQVSVEFDYFTAVDDLSPREETGAGMIGTVEFNSACYYRYANVDLDQLQKNLAGDVELARQTLDAFLRASVAAIPSGKQNSMAAQNPPSLVMSVVRKAGAWSLANAFVRPVRPQGEDDLIAASVRALDRYWKGLTGMYGLAESGITHVRVSTTEDAALESLRYALLPNVPALIAATVKAAYGNGGGA